jgi:chromosome segregation ATPase
MTRAEREAIRARHSAPSRKPETELTRSEIRALLAEVDRLEAECTRRAQSEAGLRGDVERLTAERDAARAEASDKLFAAAKRITDVEAHLDAAQRALAEANEQIAALRAWSSPKALAEAQAREVALREALSSICGHVFNTTDVWHIAHDALLAVPADDAALREFVQRCLMPLSPSNRAEVNEKLDAVLRGSR